MEDRQEIKEHYTKYLRKFTEYHFNKGPVNELSDNITILNR